MVNTAAQGLVHNEPSLIHNLQEKAGQICQDTIDAGVDFPLLCNPQ